MRDGDCSDSRRAGEVIFRENQVGRLVKIGDDFFIDCTSLEPGREEGKGEEPRRSSGRWWGPGDIKNDV